MERRKLFAQKHPLVVCPWCGEIQELRFGRLRWTMDDRGEVTDAYCVCRRCEGRIREEDRGQVNWLLTKDFKEVAKAFLLAQTGPVEMRQFVFEACGEEWIEPEANGNAD